MNTENAIMPTHNFLVFLSFIYFGSLDSIKVNYYKVDTDVPTMSPTRPAQPTRIIVCTAVQTEVVSILADLEFYYSVPSCSAIVTTNKNIMEPNLTHSTNHVI